MNIFFIVNYRRQFIKNTTAFPSSSSSSEREISVLRIVYVTHYTEKEMYKINR